MQSAATWEGSGSGRRYADAPKQPGIKVPLHGQRERGKARRGGEREQVRLGGRRRHRTTGEHRRNLRAVHRTAVLQDSFGHRPRRRQASEAPVSACRGNRQILQERRVMLLAKSMRQSAKWSNTEQPGSSITSGTRQSVREGDSRRLSKSDPWHRTKQGQKRSLAAVPGFPNAA